MGNELLFGVMLKAVVGVVWLYLLNLKLSNSTPICAGVAGDSVAPT